MMRFGKIAAVAGLLGLAACAELGLVGDEASRGSSFREGMVLLSGLDVTNPENDGRLQRIIGGLLEGGRENPANRGPSSIVVEALREGSFRTAFDLDAFIKQAGDPRCAVAKKEKIAFHLANGGVVPASFGKMTRYDLREYAVDRWEGSIELCTWIKSGSTYDEYFFHMDLLGGLAGSVRTVRNTGNPANPFPGTLNLAGVADPSIILSMMQNFEVKLHGKDEAVKIANAWKNGVFIPRTDPIYIEAGSCFDIFFVDQADLDFTKANNRLPDQTNYCMGRCDTRVLNTM